MKDIVSSIKPYVESGLVSEQAHPHDPAVRIFNYTQACQFSKKWDEVTKGCRGLIVNVETGEILARPFQKFFNYQEHLANSWPIPQGEKPIITEKLDGSLGILYFLNDKPYIATRGSFTSDQALWATEWWRKNVGWLPPEGVTHLFEIIYPENRIVVNYDFSGLVHIASIDKQTGKQVLGDFCWPSPVREARSIDADDVTKLLEMDIPNEEGFVIYYPESDVRLKVKFPEYVRLHRIVTGVSEIAIWEMLRDEKDFSELLEKVPDEFHAWFEQVVARLKAEYQGIYDSELKVAEGAREVASDRKGQAGYIMANSKHPGVAFSILDGKDYKQAIWRMVRPRGQSSFKKDIDL